jgi:hypothetical protein
VNDAVDQDGYVLSGTVTTDGTIGALSPSDITAWSFAITQGNSVVDSLSSEALGATVSGYQSGGLGPHDGFYVTASASTLTVMPGGLEFFDAADMTSLVFRPAVMSYYATDAAGNPLWTASPPSGYTTKDWVFATTSVPEPSSLFLSGSALVLGLGAWARSRRGATLRRGIGVPILVSSGRKR